MGLLNQVGRLGEKPVDYKKLLNDLEKNPVEADLRMLFDLLELDYEELTFPKKIEFFKQIKQLFDEGMSFFEIKNELLGGIPSVEKVVDNTKYRLYKNFGSEEGIDMGFSGRGGERAWF